MGSSYFCAFSITTVLLGTSSLLADSIGESSVPFLSENGVCNARDFLLIINNTQHSERSLVCINDEIPANEGTVSYYEAMYESQSNQCERLLYSDLISDILEYNKVCKKPDINFATLNGSGEKIPRKVYCTPKKLSQNTTAKVQIINSTVLQERLNSTKDENEHYCAVVMFFAPWCHFCARTAPHYNALARAFPHMDIFAIDAVIHSSINFRYGTVAVPNILIFHNSKAVARFNTTERTLERLSSFISNVTGMAAESAEITEEDYSAPLASTPTKHLDWYLWLAWAVVIIFSSTLFLKSSVAQSIWNILGNHMGHIEQAHID